MRDYTPPPTDAKTILTHPVHFLAFGFGTGLAPKGPGTVGTLAGLPVYWAICHLSLPLYVAACALLFIVGCWICGRSSAMLGVHDHGGIVFDEMVGLCVTAIPLIALGGSAWWLIPAFISFRFFDILKPWPIGWVDARVKGGLGIMIDDLFAGLMAAAVVYLLMRGLPLISA